MSSGAFIGRVAELHQLDANLRAARAGDFRLVLLVGEAGVGKSRLLAEFLDHAAGTRVMTGACLPLESATLPYAPMVDALHELIHGLPAEEVDEVIGPARPELARLLPELEVPDAQMPDEQAEPMSRARFFDLLLGVIERAAHSTVAVLAIEDVHWADPATRDLLRVLVRGLRRTPVLLVVTLRADASPESAAGRHFAAELARLGAAIRIDLPAFDEDEVRALTAELSGRQPSAAVVGRLMSRSDGIPFVVEQLVTAGEHEDDLPPTLADMVGARLSRISPEGREVLGIVAALGRRVDRTLTAEISGLAAADVDAGMREAIDAGILVRVASEQGVRYEFRHALVREVVERGLLDSDRQRLHGAAAAALEADPAAGSAATASEAAYHWEAAEAWDRALAAHLTAGAHAKRLYAWGTAVFHYERALRLYERVPAGGLPEGVDRAELLHLAADAAYLAGDHASALARGREAIDMVIDRDPPRAGALHERLRWYLWDSGDRRGAMASVAEALRLIPSDPPSQALASVLGQQAGVLMHTGRTDEAAEAAAHALDVARRAESMADIGQALAMLGWARVIRGEVDDGLATIRQAGETAEMAGDVSGIALGGALLANMLIWVGRHDDARQVALEGYDRVVELGVQRTCGGMLLGYAVHVMIADGSWQLADSWIERGLLQEPSGQPAHWLRINRARLLTLRGSFPEAEQELLEADAHEASSGGTEYRDDLVAAHAELAAWRGLPQGGVLAIGGTVEHRGGRRAAPQLVVDEALGPASLGTVAELVLSRPPSVPFGPAAAWAIAHLLMAEADEAERARAVANHDREVSAIARADALVAQAEAAMAAQSGLLQSPAWRALSELCGTEGARARGQADPEAWEGQLAAWTDVGDPFRAAYARYRLGARMLAIPAQRAAAAEHLDAAGAAADALGATVLSDRVSLVRSPARRSAVTTMEEDAVLERPDRLTVHALGRLQILRDGVPIRSIGGPKAGRRQAEALFAFLLDRGHKGITKDELVEMIWPEQDLAAADLAFHRTLGGLRRVLEPDLGAVSASVIGFDHDRYTLDPRVVAWTDFGAFELAMEEARSTPDPFVKASALEEGRRLYRGDYFDDCPFFGDSPEVEPTRRRLRADFVDLLVMLGELAEERGDARGAATLYREAVENADDDLPIAAAGLSRIGQLGAQVRAIGA